jgi:hypothetical protein
MSLYDIMETTPTTLKLIGSRATHSAKASVLIAKMRQNATNFET